MRGYDDNLIGLIIISLFMLAVTGFAVAAVLRAARAKVAPPRASSANAPFFFLAQVLPRLRAHRGAVDRARARGRPAGPVRRVRAVRRDAADLRGVVRRGGGGE